MLHIICVRVGQKYSREYVAVLHDMVTRNLDKPHRFWCLTDDERPIHPDIEIIPAHPDLPGWWQKVYLFSRDMPWDYGDRIAYFDLDVAIVGRLEELVETLGIIRDWHVPGFNSSVMVWDHGKHQEIMSRFYAGSMEELNGDQDWISSVETEDGCDRWAIFPRDWCVSYRSHATDWPPVGTKVVVFHGKPDPHECDGWVKDVWKIGGLTEFPTLTGMNTSFDTVRENIILNSARDLEWFVGGAPHNETAVIVAGGPSLKTSVEAIRAHRQRGAKIIAVNGTAAFLNAHKIIPDVLVIADARPENIKFTEARAKRYLLASQCHPSLFEALAGEDVHVWHAAVFDEIRELLDPYWETKPICVIGGGGTVGLRAINLLIVSGYQRLHLYGFDSSFETNHHAYPQAMNDNDKVLTVTLPATGKTYQCTPFMIRQAAEFRDIAAPALKENHVRCWVHGSGLLPDMAKEIFADAD